MSPLFLESLARVFGHEGGFANDPDDTGGATQMGITRRTLSRFRRKPVSIADVRNLTRREATQIYWEQYWNRVRADSIDPGLAYTLFDFYVNTSPRGVAKAVQRAVGARVDGVWGQQTWGMLLAMPTELAIRRIAVERLRHMRRLKNWWKYRNGWTIRVNDVQWHSLILMDQAAEGRPFEGRLV